MTESKLTNATFPWDLGGRGKVRDDLTVEQDGARAAVLEFLTVMANKSSVEKLVPLIDVDPTLTFANMVCGAIGGTAAEFSALADAEFAITVDGVLTNIIGLDLTGLDTVLDTPGYMTCGAIGGTLAEFAAAGANCQFGLTVDGVLMNITADFSGLDSVADTAGYLTCGAIGAALPAWAAVNDAQFGITLDGQAEIQVGPIDYSGLDTEADTAGFFTCGVNGDIIANWDGLADASFSIVVNGVAFDTGQMNLTTCVTFGDVVNVINFFLEGVATIEYSWNTNIFRFVSNTTGEPSIVAEPGAPAGGTDISGAAWLNAPGGAATAGAGGEGTGQTIQDITNAALIADGAAAFCYYNGDAFVFVSQTRGETSEVADLTAGGVGTDVSGAGFFNGLAGVNVQGAGGENLGQNISDTINAASQGRFTCHFSGDAFIFTSRTAGELSTVSDLVAGAGGVDVSGAGFLNGLAGVNVQGTGGEGLYESISEIINAQAAGRFTVDFDGDAFVFYSPTPGLPGGVITVLTAVVAGTGTDISGAGFLNGLVGIGTVTAATGSDGTDRPAGLFMSKEITAAAIVAGDVDNQVLLVGSDKMIDEDMIVFEGGLSLASVVVATGRTIREELELMGIYPRKSINSQQIQPI